MRLPSAEESFFLVDKHLMDYAPITVVRLGDGERDVLWKKGDVTRSQKFGYEGKEPTGFTFKRDAPSSDYVIERLTKAYQYSSPTYYLAPLPGMCTREVLVHQDRSRVLSVELFSKHVKLSWEMFHRNLTNRKVALLCHRSADVQGLPFHVDNVFTTGRNSQNDVKVELEVTTWAGSCDGYIILLAAGVLSKMLAWQIDILRRSHTLLDVGSLFDPLMGLGKTRVYLQDQLKSP